MVKDQGNVILEVTLKKRIIAGIIISIYGVINMLAFFVLYSMGHPIAGVLSVLLGLFFFLGGILILINKPKVKFTDKGFKSGSVFITWDKVTEANVEPEKETVTVKAGLSQFKFVTPEFNKIKTIVSGYAGKTTTSAPIGAATKLMAKPPAKPMTKPVTKTVTQRPRALKKPATSAPEIKFSIPVIIGSILSGIGIVIILIIAFMSGFSGPERVTPPSYYEPTIYTPLSYEEPITTETVTGGEEEEEEVEVTLRFDPPANKFEWASNLGCGSGAAYDPAARACIPNMYSELVELDADVMDFTEWIGTHPEWETMNRDGQNNRYADYMWGLKKELI